VRAVYGALLRDPRARGDTVAREGEDVERREAWRVVSDDDRGAVLVAPERADPVPHDPPTPGGAKLDAGSKGFARRARTAWR
jgi:hypothetical protein